MILLELDITILLMLKESLLLQAKSYLLFQQERKYVILLLRIVNRISIMKLSVDEITLDYSSYVHSFIGENTC